MVEFGEIEASGVENRGEEDDGEADDEGDDGVDRCGWLWGGRGRIHGGRRRYGTLAVVPVSLSDALRHHRPLRNHLYEVDSDYDFDSVLTTMSPIAHVKRDDCDLL
jgi:hypothetical protein